MTWEKRVQSGYAQLSPKMKRAAQFVLEHPEKVALQSMRTVANDAGLTPPTFTRLAQTLGYDGFDDIRDEVQRSFTTGRLGFQDRADALIRASQDGSSFVERMSKAAVENIQSFDLKLDTKKVEDAARMLHEAKRVIVIGALASSGIADYFGYTASWVCKDWVVAGRGGVSLSGAVAGLSKNDALIVITMNPYARRTVASVEEAKRRGAGIVLITDDISSPALPHANFGFVMPTDSPQFFSSYVATLLLIEILVGMLVVLGGDQAKARIAEVEETNRQIGEYRFGTNQT